MASLMNGVETRGRCSLASAARLPRVYWESLADESPCISGYTLQSDTPRCRGRRSRWPCELLKEKTSSQRIDEDHWTRDACEDRTKTDLHQYSALREYSKMTYALHGKMIIESAYVDHAEVLHDESVRDIQPLTVAAPQSK